MLSGRRREFIVLCVVGIINCSALILVLRLYDGDIPLIRKRVTNIVDNLTIRSGCGNDTSTTCFSVINASHSDTPRASRNETTDLIVQRNATFQNVRGALSGFTSLKDLYDTIDRDWSFNATEADNLRSVLERYCNISGLFPVTQENVQPDQELRYTVDLNDTFAITRRTHQRFIKKIPFQQKSFKKCSLVGNSGILLGSKCGKAIDSADLIFRFGRLNEQGAERFKKYMTEEYKNAHILVPAFTKTRCTEPAFKAQDILEPTKLQVNFIHPYFQTLVRRFWINQKNLGAVMTSTGLNVFTAAMSFCEEVHLYGYWPFAEDQDGNPVYFHYFNKDTTMLSRSKLQAVHHDMPAEFKMYIELQNKGAIKLHVGHCDV
ncbi:alpha-2,8-sialyltransferase 8E-like isoform X2 [Ptychodera flava]|uniref:alpha-2,8-sialyltransferase 8E-like isoform X2 n=1 Tax=Ptychodera flava TaxID=63121 RepID=UPI00396A77FC